jgi:AcrR family transcriptional regulator
MSLYHYIANKDELLDAMVDVVFAEIEPPPLDVDWKVAMRAEALSAREGLARHPWAISLMESRPRPGRRTCGIARPSRHAFVAPGSRS